MAATTYSIDRLPRRIVAKQRLQLPLAAARVLKPLDLVEGNEPRIRRQREHHDRLSLKMPTPEPQVDLVDRLDRIRTKLERLRAADSSFSVFGSDAHQYRLRPPLPPEALSDLEKHLGVQLPDEYRLFVAQLGDGGAGPYYGLIPLDDHDLEDLTQPDLTRKPFRWTAAFNPYDWDDPCSQEDVWCDDEDDSDEEMAEEGNREEDEEAPQRQIILGVPGALYICHYGCGIRLLLIVNGQSCGEVWRDAQNDDAGLRPECDDRSRHMGFMDWYERWLDESLATIGPPQQDSPEDPRNDAQEPSY